MKKYLDKKTIVILLSYVVLAASVGVFFPFNALYLSSTLDFSNTQISFIDGSGQLLAMIFLPIAGIISDKTRSPGFVFIFLMLLSGMLMLLYAQVNSFIMVSLVYILYLALRRGIFPILDALTLNHCEEYKLDFGIFRSVYSGTYMLFALIMGYLFINQVKIDNSFIYLSLSFNVFVVILALFLPKIYVPSDIKVNLKEDLKELVSNKKYLLFSITVALSMATISIVAMYNSTIIAELGGTIDNIGISTIMQVGSEVIFALFALKLARKFTHLKVVMYSILLLLITWLIIYFNYRYQVYFSLIWIEGFATVFILIVGMDYVKTIVLPQVISSSITIYTSITLLFYALLVNLAGLIRDYYSTQDMFLFLAVINMIALALILFLIFKLRYNKIENT